MTINFDIVNFPQGSPATKADIQKYFVNLEAGVNPGDQPPEVKTASTYTLKNLTNNVFGEFLVFEFISGGTDFTYSGDQITGGTVTQLNVYSGFKQGTDIVSRTLRAELTNVNWDAADLYSAVVNADAAAFDAIFYEQDNFNYSGDLGKDTFTGSIFGDVINGEAGNDTLFGDKGDDAITGDAGNDTLDGGAGIDTVDYSYLTGGQNLTLTLGAYNTKTGDVGQTKTSGVAGDVDSIKNFENVIGGDGDDRLTGNALGNLLQGNAGNDTLVGLGGADVLDGGDGIDTVNYSASKEGVVVNLNQQGTYFNDDPADGRDTAGSAQQGGDAAGDLLWSIESVVGSAKDDILTARNSDNSTQLIDAGAGNDFVFASKFGETLLGGAGTDTLSFAQDTSGVNANLVRQGTAAAGRTAVTGGVNNGEVVDGYNVAEFENLTGGAGNDELTGDSKNNVIEGGAGADELVGGLGIDTVSYAGSATGVTVLLDFQGTSNADGSKGFAGNAQSGGDAAGDLLWGFENIIGSSHDDLLDGGDGPNNIQGGDGDDQIGGGVGNDVLDGGAGFDILRMNHLDDNVTVTLGAYDSKTGNVALSKTSGVKNDVDSFKNFEGIQGGNGGDKLTGNAGDNLIQGGGSGDIIQGLGGADRLDGGSGRDTVTYAASSGAVTIDFSLNDEIDPEFSGKQKGGDAEGDQLARFDILVGSKYSDILVGEAGGDDLIIDGGAGDDIIGGIATSNFIIGGTGNDTIHYGDYLGNGNDINIDIGVTVDLQLQLTFDKSYSPIFAKGKNDSDYQQQGGNAGGNLLSGIENIVGSEGNDFLIGDKFNNVIEGGKGEDKLVGGLGIDTVSYANSASGVLVSLTFQGESNADGSNGADGLELVGGDADGDLLWGFENIIGSSKDDILSGDEKANNIHGGDGDDAITGNEGNDTLDGGAGFDTLSFGYLDSNVTVTLGAYDSKTGNTALSKTSGVKNDVDTFKNFEVVNGGDGDDTLTGNAADNELFGSDGNDVIQGLGGADILDGASGTDTVTYAASAAAVTVNFALNHASNPQLSGKQTGGDAEGDQLARFEILIGSKYNDVLSGDHNVNIIDGGAGDDLIIGNDGADILIGGAGIDTVSYATSGAVTISLLKQGAYNAKTGVFTGPAQDGAGSDAEGDKLSGFENVIGSFDADTLIGDSKNNVIEGGAGADTLIGLGGIDTVSYEGSGAGVTVSLFQQGTSDAAGENLSGGSAQSGGHAAGDFLYGFENIIGSEFDDVLTTANNGGSLWGLGGADTLNGEINKVDKLYGGDGDDLLNGLGGKDLLDGGAGIDTVNFAGIAYGGKSLTITLGKNDTTAASVSGGAAGLKIYAVENLIGSSGNDKFTANNEDIDNEFIGFGGNDILSGLTGDDALDGGDGDDTLIGGEGEDILDGGNNFDTADYSASKSAVTIAMDQQGTYIDDDPYQGRDDAPVKQTGGTGDSVGDQFWSIERVIGSAFNDQLKGASTDGYVLDGGKGDDLIIAGAGEEILVGGLNTAAGDTVSYELSGAAVTVSLLTQGTYNPVTGLITGASAQAQSSGSADGDFLSGFENVIGSTSDDLIFGDSKNNIIEGYGGADTMIGGAGSDTVSYKSSVFQVTVNLNDQGTYDPVTYQPTGPAPAIQKGGDAEGDMLGGFENIIGSDRADQGDVLTGDAKNNVITGGLGADELTGGGGNDTFAFLSADDGGDAITDFNAGDRISLSKTGFGNGLENLKSVTAAYLLSGTDPEAGMTTDQHGYLLFDTDYAGGQNALYWDADGTGGNAAILIAVFENDYVLQAKDFVLV